MIAELAEPKIGANVPRLFPHVCDGSGVETSIVYVYRIEIQCITYIKQEAIKCLTDNLHVKKVPDEVLKVSTYSTYNSVQAGVVDSHVQNTNGLILRPGGWV